MKILNLTAIAGKDIKKGQKIIIKLGKKNFIALPKLINKRENLWSAKY